MIHDDAKPSSKRRRGRNKDSSDIPTENAAPSSKNLILDLPDRWYKFNASNQAFTAELKAHTEKPCPSELVSKYERIAKTLYDKEVATYEKGKNSDEKWVDSTIRHGTLKDRIAAMSVLVSGAPVHKFRTMDGLLQMAGVQSSVGNSRVAQLAGEALEDLFCNTLIPNDRKLIPLRERPLQKYEKSAKSLSPKILLLWYFEDILKTTYTQYIKLYLAKTLHEGTTEPQRIASVRTAANLLRCLPEGEAAILKLLVNKLGDPMRKVAACAGHELHRVLTHHPAMRHIVAREVQQLLHRSKLSPKAMYNGVNFLNQIIFQRNDAELAKSLIQSYFTLFEVAVSTDLQGRFLSALIIGVNRAVPYAGEQVLSKDHLDKLYKVVYVPTSAIPALALLYELSSGDDRFCRAFYTELPTILLSASKKHMTMCFNLLYKMLKYEKNTDRLIAMTKKILICSLHSNAAVAAACVFLIKEVSKHQAILQDCYANVLDSTDAARYLDATKRDPRFAMTSDGLDASTQTQKTGQKAGLWELTLLKHHYHPTVQKFAEFDPIDYSGDPLVDFSVATFLDKFAYRNPKKQVVRPDNHSSVHSGNKRSKHIQLPVNDSKFLEQGDFNVEDEFFKTFFRQRAKTNAHKKHMEREDEQIPKEWESDEEEDAFVDSLAEKLLVEQAGGVPADLDDEDPDTSEWNDIYNGSDNDEDSIPDTTPRDEADDAFMEADDSSDEDIPSNEDGPSNEPSGALDSQDDEDGSDSDELKMLADEDDEQSDDEAPNLVNLPTTTDTGTFADADDYAELIEESWQKQKRVSPDEDDSPAKKKKRQSKK